jgi:tetratricopeptide (TPR) repeat protein
MQESKNLKIALDNALEHINNNRLNESIEQLNEILKYNKNHIPTLDLLVKVYIKFNQPTKALTINQKIIDIEPNNRFYLEQKIKFLKYLNDFNGYEKALLELNEKYPSIEVARILSNLYLSQDDEEKSDYIIQNFFESNKNYSELYKGIRHVKAGRLKLAEEVYKNILKKDKNNIDALRLFGLLAFKLKKYDIAEQLFIKVLKLNPSFALAWDNLAKLYRIQNKLSKSIPAFKNLIKLDPNNFEALVSLGTVYIKLSKYKDGIELYKRALVLNPENARVHLSMGHALKTLGNREECERAYQNAIKHYPLSGEAYWSLANLKTYQFDSNEIVAMENAIKNNMHQDELIQVYFALGKAYETNKNYKKSFKNYQKGNWEQRKKINYNAEEYKKYTDEIIQFFSSNNDLLNINKGYLTKDPIFILGLPRSGSTLIEQILSSHSLIEGTQELPNIMGISREIKSMDIDKKYPSNIKLLNDDDFYNYGLKYINETKWTRSDKPYFIDKMPNNYIHIGLIKLILPNAKIIDARRNPMDACFSCFKQYFARGQHFTYDLDDIARYYKDYERLMDFWKSIFSDSIYTIKYEDVINDPHNEVHSLLNYLELDFEDSCLNFYKSKRPVKTASSEQVRQPIYKSGLDYWLNYEGDLLTLRNHFNI